MTEKEHNRDIKKLADRLVKLSASYTPHGENKEYYAELEGPVKAEFIRLYHADTSFSGLTLLSIKLMLRMNLRYRFIALHVFGINMKINGYEDF